MARALVALGVGIAVLAMLPRNSQAMTDTAAQDTSDAPDDADWNPEVWPPSPDEIQNEDVPMPAAATDEDLSARIAAMLYAIRSCEHVYPQNVLDGACYGIFYAGQAGFNAPEFLNQRFSNFSNHPVLTGECKPVPLPDTVCRNAGLNPGCVSTAAGAYQIILPTWRNIGAGLPDFSPASQDAAATRILESIGAIEMLQSGNVQGALAKASRIWASLPGSSAHQSPKTLAYAMARFDEGLSSLA